MYDIMFFQNLIVEFLNLDSQFHAGHAANLWPKILALAYPFLNGKCLSECLVLLVLRGRRNQMKHGAHDFGEIFAGCANLTKEMIRGGYCGSAIDMIYDQSQNVLVGNGLRLVLDSISCIKYGGLLWLATKCSSFVVLCRAVSQRNAENHYLGDTGRAFVSEGNNLMEITAMLYLIAFLCGLMPVLEQPSSSVLPGCLSMKLVLIFTKALKCTTYLGCFGGPSQKPLQLWSPRPCIYMLQRARPVDMFSEPLVRRHGDDDHQFTGHKDLLVQSQQYTEEFGKAIMDMCRAEWEEDVPA